jgi:dTDP-4-amino-4,6-dideoxygalactose transaminase
MTSVPFLDLNAMHAPVADALVEGFADLVRTGAFTNGPDVKRFEQAFAAYCGVRECVGLGSGLDGLRLALLALGVGPGDEVIVPAQTFIATWEAVSQTGAIPVPVEIRGDDYGIDPDAAAAAITGRTRAILPVHLYGQMADITGLAALGVPMVEDACQAHGARRDGILAGSVGVAAAFSFYPGKNLGAMGDGGALVTSDAELALRVRALREHGQRAKYVHETIGWTARLDTVQAMVLLHKLDLLDGWNAERRAVAAALTRGLEGVGDLVLPAVVAGSEPVWHLYVVQTDDPVALAAHLADLGVSTGRHYPEPPHLTGAYAGLGLGAGAFPVAERVARTCLSLPIFPGMTEVQVEATVAGVRSFFDRG